MKIFIRFLNGCVMRRQKEMQYNNFFVQNGHELVDSATNSDYIIIWGCSFRADWRDASLSVINYYIDNFKQKIIIAGCLPSIAPEYIKKNKRIKLIPWKDDKCFDDIFGDVFGLYKFNPVFIQNKICDNTEEYRKNNKDKDVTFHDQFVKVVIAIGCGFNCSYCSEKLAFPKYMSFSEKDIIKKCKDIIDKTKNYDVMLLADNLGQYGRDINSSLPKLIKKIKKIHPNIKFALNNLNPIYFIKFIDEMKFFIKNNWIKHLNLPIQSASDDMLKLMRRPYNKKDLIKIFVTLNELNFKDFDTHIIVGFPGETECDLIETIAFLLSIRPRYVLVSRYMEAKHTTSAKLLNKIDEKTVNDRIEKIKENLDRFGILYNTDDGELSSTRLKNLMKKE